jgi:hypothetical protein
MTVPRRNAGDNGRRNYDNLYLSTCQHCRECVYDGGKPRVWCPPGMPGWVHTDCAKQRLAGALLEA